MLSAVSEGISDEQARDRAMRNISFGKRRQNRGYGGFVFGHSRDVTTVTHEAKGRLLEKPLEGVPRGVEIKGAELINRNQLDQALAKYEEAYENGRE